MPDAALFLREICPKLTVADDAIKIFTFTSMMTSTYH
jgi:hypothetical protein